MTQTIQPPASRNDHCPCGSGKRYKHCHGLVAPAPTNPAPALGDTVWRLMQSALLAQRGNRLTEAQGLYDQALALDPGQPDALHMRGVVSLTEGDPRTAFQFITRAINAGLDNPDVRNNLSLCSDGIRMRVAAAALDAAVSAEPVAQTRFISPKDVQLLAFFLPQFHAIAENDEWWGEGFTEWTNVRRARRNFLGHDQPRQPGELGYYNLLDPEVRVRQAALAQEHGITGFCYYHYWFKGKQLLETPLEQVLNSGQPDFPFCVFWANENWSKRWDGGENELLVEQLHDAADDVAFIEHLLPYFSDPRYIRVDGRPLLMIYRIDRFPEPRQTIARWRAACAAHGIPAPYVVKADIRPSGAPELYNADASVEFPPHQLAMGSLLAQKPAELDPDYIGTLIDYRAAAVALATAAEPAHTHFKTVAPDWDNSARRQLDGTTFLGSSPGRYEAWLRDSLVRAERMLPPGRRMVFVNAWNEWAEGAYLEPDATRGRAMLQSTLAARQVPVDYQNLESRVASLVRGDLATLAANVS